MTDTEIERLLVRIVGDQSSLHSELLKAQSDLSQMEKAIGRTSEATGRFTANSMGAYRGIHMIGNALRSAITAQKPEQLFMSMGHIAMGFGRQFGMAGMVAGTSVSILTGLVQRLNHELRDKGVEAANKAFSSIVDGSKTAGQAVAVANEQMMKEATSDIMKNVMPADTLSKMGVGIKVWWQGVKDTLQGGEHLDIAHTWMEMLDDDFTKAVENTKRTRAVLDHLMNLPIGRELVRENTLASNKVTIEGLKAEQELREVTFGKTGKQIEIERMLQKLRHIGLNEWTDDVGKQVNELEKLKDTDLSLTLKDVNKEFQKSMLTAGMSAREIKAWELSAQGASAEAVNAAMEQARMVDEYVKGVTTLKSLREKNEAHGLSAIEAQARKLDEVGAVGLADQLRVQEQITLTNELADAVNHFNLEMAGATKSQLAYAAAADPVAAQLARAKTLMQEGIRVTQENMTPAEKFNQTHRELSDLLAHNTISQETYNRAVGKAAQQLNGVREAIQGVTTGSADAFGKLLAYQDMLTMPATIAKPVPLGPAAGANTAEAQGRQDANRLLQLILNELLAANKKQPIQLSPAGIGGGS